MAWGGGCREVGQGPSCTPGDGQLFGGGTRKLASPREGAVCPWQVQKLDSTDRVERVRA